MDNRAIVYEIAHPKARWRYFVIDNEEQVRHFIKSFDRKGVPYRVYRARVAPLSDRRWATFMTQLSNERANEVPFFFNGELLVSSDQKVEERVHFWSGEECHLRLIKGKTEASD